MDLIPLRFNEDPGVNIGYEGNDPFGSFVLKLRSIVQADRRYRILDGNYIATNPCWVRDHVHAMKGMKYWENDLASFIDCLLSLQTPDGFFYEMIMPGNSGTAALTLNEDCIKRDGRNRVVYVRLENEADIEYLIVEGVYTIWQATGDDEWVYERLPRLEKGLEYCMCNPKRWSEEHGLVKRPFTIDTWDFTYGYPSHDRRITPAMPMAIMHGDNSGMFQACTLLALLFAHFDESAKAEYWHAKAALLRENTNKVCWNGEFYTHQIHLNSNGVMGVDEKKILSLSNVYDINRGLTTQEQAASIIRTYIKRREETQATHFAEWFSIHPCYPQFWRCKPWEYINGGIASFTAGELAKAALQHGFEEYGCDILRRLQKKCDEDGTIYFLYTLDGKDQGGGPSSWGAAAILSAIVEGLAGIVDGAKCFEALELSPRWLANGSEIVQVMVRYGPSGAFVAYRYALDRLKRTLKIRLHAPSARLDFHVLLPRSTKATSVTIDDESASFRMSRIENSPYVDFMQTVGRESRGREKQVTITFEEE